MRFTRCRSFGLRQIAAVRLPRLRIRKTLSEIASPFRIKEKPPSVAAIYLEIIG
jgi:hypothetical protein